MEGSVTLTQTLADFAEIDQYGRDLEGFLNIANLFDIPKA